MASMPIPVYRVPEGWKLFTTNEIKAREPHSCVAGPFGSKISSKYFVDDGVPVIRGSNLRVDMTRFVSNGLAFVSQSRAREYLPQHVTAGDLIFTCWGTIGQVGLVPENGPYPEYIISNKQLKLRVDGDIANPLFCYYYFASPPYVSYIQNRGIGGAIPGINLGILKSLPIALPPLVVQDRIVELLSAYDDLIENNRRRIQLLEESARLLYREWFVHLRFPGHEHVKVVDGVPEGWARQPLSCFTSYINRGIAPSYDEDGDSIIVNQRCIRDGHLSLENARVQKKPVKPEKWIGIGDVLINSTGTGTLGRVAQVWDDLENTTVDTHVTIVRPTKGADVYWLGFALLRSEHLFAAMAEGATGQTELKRQKIADFEVLVPSVSLRREFGDHAADVVRQITLLWAQNQKASQARDLLLPRLMNGDIAV